MKKLRKISIYSLLGYMGTAMIYPVYSWITSDGMLLKLIDSMTIVGFVFLAFGMIRSLVFHGDFDIAEYVTRRSADSMRNKKIKPFAAFREEKEEKRKDSVNYPFLTGLLLLGVSAALIVFVY